MTRQGYKQHKTKKTYSSKFKAELVAQCINGESSVASLAVKHGMNPNVLHRWIKEYKSTGRHDLSIFEYKQDTYIDQASPRVNNWLAILPECDQSVSVPKTYSPM